MSWGTEMGSEGSNEVRIKDGLGEGYRSRGSGGRENHSWGGIWKPPSSDGVILSFLPLLPFLCGIP